MINRKYDNSMYEQIQEWLDIYHSTNDAEKRENLKTLISIRMLPVVKKLARAIARRATDPIEDMVQAGSIGLLKAIDNFSRERNDNFRVYAGYLIIGEMKHYLRDQLALIKVPRHVQELAIRINNFTQSLTPGELDELTQEELAGALKIPKKKVDFVLEMERRRTTLSFEDVFKPENESLSYEEMIAYENLKNPGDISDVKMIFNKIIEQLPTEERMLITMYYKQDMNQSEIADTLKLSKMTLNRKMKQSFKLMADLMINYGGISPEDLKSRVYEDEE